MHIVSQSSLSCVISRHPGGCAMAAGNTRVY